MSDENKQDAGAVVAEASPFEDFATARESGDNDKAAAVAAEQDKPREPESREDDERESSEREGSPKAKKRGFQGRIDQLTAEIYQERQQRTQLEERLRHLESGRTPEAKPAEPTQQPEVARPSGNDLLNGLEVHPLVRSAADKSPEVVSFFSDHPEFAAASLKWTEKDAEQIVPEIVAWVREEERVGPVVVAVADALRESDNGPAVYEYLAKNPEEAKKIGALKPSQAVREVLRISVRLETPRERPESKAPPPITPNRGANARSSELDGDMDPAEFFRRRASGRG